MPIVYCWPDWPLYWLTVQRQTRPPIIGLFWLIYVEVLITVTLLASQFLNM